MLSVVIPTLHEADNIRRLLAQLATQENVSLDIIVVDGGSTDATCEIVESSPARLVRSSPGRGRQMNAGAGVASGDWLLFLHADSGLTSETQLADALGFMAGCETSSAGHFAMAFDTPDPAVRRALAFFEAKTSLNRPGTWNGDQGLLITRHLFRLTGGFSETLPFLEDQEFGVRFSSFGSFVTLPGRLLTSARRFEEEGVVERIRLNAVIMGMFTIRHDSFFTAAPGIYRDASAGARLNIRPFLYMARQAVFDRGFLTGLSRCMVIGRLVARNAWQLFLARGVRTGQVSRWLDYHDRYAAWLTLSPAGTLLGTLAVVSWFLALQASLFLQDQCLGVAK